MHKGKRYYNDRMLFYSLCFLSLYMSNNLYRIFNAVFTYMVDFLF